MAFSTLSGNAHPLQNFECIRESRSRMFLMWNAGKGKRNEKEREECTKLTRYHETINLSTTSKIFPSFGEEFSLEKNPSAGVKIKTKLGNR